MLQSTWDRHYRENGRRKKVEHTYYKYREVKANLSGPGKHKHMAKVIKKLNDNHHQNPILDTSEYLVQFPDGEAKELTVNLIVESMFSDIDKEGHHFQILS